jgi:hypothetical protein
MIQASLWRWGFPLMVVIRQGVLEKTQPLYESCLAAERAIDTLFGLVFVWTLPSPLTYPMLGFISGIRRLLLSCYICLPQLMTKCVKSQTLSSFLIQVRESTSM